MLLTATATLALAFAPAPAPQPGVEVVASYAGTTAWVDDGAVLVRQGGKTRTLDIAPPDDLDLGPGPTGSTVAVFSRCAPSCDVYFLDLGRENAREMRVDVAARPGVSERLPTIWRDRLAFVVDDDLLVAPIDNGRAKRVARDDVIDLELGPDGVLASSGEFSSDEGNGESGVFTRELDHGNHLRWVDSQVIGEGSAAGFGALTAERSGLYYARLFRVGCGRAERVTRRYDAQRRRATKVTGSVVPLAARTATFAIPLTPMSEDCGD